jgi:hypothetical protein
MRARLVGRSLLLLMIWMNSVSHPLPVMSLMMTMLTVRIAGMGLFQHWLMSGGKLHGPHDFHSFAHYLSLYVLAKKFQIETLENQGMLHIPPNPLFHC